MPRRLKVDLEDLGLAFDNGSGEMDYYLDPRTGDVILLTYDARREVERILEELGEDAGEDDFRSALDGLDLANEEKSELLYAFLAENGTTDDLIPVPHDESSEGYRDMETFVEGLTDQGARARLERAISGSRPFLRFKDAIEEFPALREQWFAYRDQRQEVRIREWLEDEDIELITEDNTPAT